MSYSHIGGDPREAFKDQQEAFDLIESFMGYLPNSHLSMAKNPKLNNGFGALKTPHFFLFDNQWELLYTGRNTDNPRDINRRTTDDLEEAIKQATESREVTIPVTNPIGCNIKWEGKPAHWMPPEACDLI